MEKRGLLKIIGSVLLASTLLIFSACVPHRVYQSPRIYTPSPRIYHSPRPYHPLPRYHHPSPHRYHRR